MLPFPGLGNSGSQVGNKLLQVELAWHFAAQKELILMVILIPSVGCRLHGPVPFLVLAQVLLCHTVQFSTPAES